MNIHQTKEYLNVFKCKGYKPLDLEKAKGKILYRFGIPYKTIFGGMCGTGLTEYSEETIKEILRKSKGTVVIYDFNEKPILEKYGFKKYDDYTFIVDISNIEELWKRLNKKNRNNIRKAEKLNVLFEEIKSIEELDRFYFLFIDQAKRWNFRIPSKDYFENVWNFMVKKNLAKFFIAKWKDEIISIIQIFMFQDEISMPIWGNSEKANQIRGANNFLIWKVIEWGNKNNYKKFNMWGANPKQEGIFKFKESFGGHLVKVYRYEKGWWLYSLAKKILKR
ncbi:MAG: peptidoglycan bridge formation glycyltransferase FemA/FemB family protein [Candidatus Pacearchaeota archaeon]